MRANSRKINARVKNQAFVRARVLVVDATKIRGDDRSLAFSTGVSRFSQAGSLDGAMGNVPRRPLPFRQLFRCSQSVARVFLQLLGHDQRRLDRGEADVRVSKRCLARECPLFREPKRGSLVVTYRIIFSIRSIGD